MHRRRITAVVAAALSAVSLLAACGRSAGGDTTGNINPLKGLVSTTAPGKKPVSSVTWAVYRDVNSLDPIFAFDYPENTAVSLLCESLLRQSPSGAIGPGLATLATPSDTKFVFTIKSGASFWDGNPVTPTDVVYSLDRASSTTLGGFYSAVFSRVKSIAASGSNSVTITLKQPDYWLQGELASMPGIVIEKKFAEAQGKNYGTPGGSAMCTGAYKLKSFSPGVGVTAVSNAAYWNKSVHPLVQTILLKGVPDVSSFTSGLQTGAISG
ncbi:MAG: peptide/nickel transport system substrate-binding protein, partial [Chloroflexota bacterium]|nr:peptide/nickel transport system substrate-binding protein [Chloroflexota bacterium]